jgi:3-oxoacyl-[acyl-carrier protein] reductase
MVDELKGLNAIVCGSTQGIGRACALEFARRGAAVALLARDADALEKTLAALPGAGHRALVADFSNPEAVRAAAARHVGEVGTVHVLLNNTGGPPGGPLLEATPHMFLTTFTAHLLCSHLLVQTVVPGMKQARYGRIVNVISTSVKQPIAGLGVSNTIRGAVAAWAKTLSGELGPFGITVNNVLPGYTDTKRLEFVVAARAKATGRSGEEVERDMAAEVPAGRFGRSEELAAVAAFLAGPAASYVNGVSIPVDGGRTTAL